jgi:GAF domain-containing protein
MHDLEIQPREELEQLRRRIAELEASEEEHKRAEEEAGLLQTVTLAVSEAEDFNSALGVALRRVCEATGWVFGEAWVPGSDGAFLECSPAWHAGVDGLEDFRSGSEGVTFPPGVGLAGRAWSSGRSAWMRDVSADEEFVRVGSAREAGLKASMAIPVTAGDEVVAVMIFYVSEPREEDERLVGLVSAVASQLGTLFQRKRAEEALRAKTEQLTAVTDAMATFLESGDFQKASALLISNALRQTDSEYGFVGVVVEGPVLRILAHEGIVWDEVAGREFYNEALRTYQEVGYLEFTNFENLFGKVITSREVVVSNDPASDPSSSGLPPGHPPMHSFLGVPILSGTEVVGVIGVANRTKDTPATSRPISRFCPRRPVSSTIAIVGGNGKPR